MTEIELLEEELKDKTQNAIADFQNHFRNSKSHLFTAYAPKLNKRILAKLVYYKKNPQFTRDLSIQRLRNEAFFLFNNNHPNIIQLIAYYHFSEATLLLFEYIPGPTFYKYIFSEYNDGKDQSILRMIELMKSISSGLKFIHEKRIIHRDIKPSNIIISNDNQNNPSSITAKIIDFTTSISIGQDISTEQSAVGTLHFMSPEQVQRMTLTPKSDIFSLGSTFYLAIQKNEPFHSQKKSNRELRRKILNHHPEFNHHAKKYPNELLNLIRHMMEKKSENRPTSAEVLSILNKF